MELSMKLLILLFGAGAIIVLAIANQPRIPNNVSSVTEIESYIEKLVARNRPPGVSVVIVKNGEIAYGKAFGYADGPANILATTDTVYHWWSMTKVPTAIAILQLHDAGKLDIDDPVENYLPFFQVTLDGEPAPPITIRQVLRHTSGLPDTIPAMIGWVHYEDIVYDQTSLLQKHLPQYNQLKFMPDSKAAYSNLGYMVLGAVIEKVSEMRYEEYIEENILMPLGMNNTDFLYTSQMEGKIAAGSHPIPSMYTPLLPFLLDTTPLIKEREGTQYWFNPFYIDVTPSTGLIGSASDVALLAQALLSQSDILTSESHSLLYPRGTAITERPLGWAEYNTNDRLWLQHSGGGPGFATILRIYPKENLGIVIMANNTNLPREKLVDAFASLDWQTTQGVSQ